MNKDHGSHRTVACKGHHGGCEAIGSRWNVVGIVVQRGLFSSVWVWVWVCHDGFGFKYCEIGFEFKLCICVSCNCETTSF